MVAASEQTAKAVAAASQKRTAEGVLFMDCAVCEKPMRKWRSQVARAKMPPTCSRACRSEAMRGERNPRSTGGVWMDARSGYRHLRTDMLSAEDRALLPDPMPRTVPEHRMVIARLLGRWPTTREHVHHLNGIKTDNRPENLSLMDWAEHSREHRTVLRRMASLEAENRILRAALAARQ